MIVILLYDKVFSVLEPMHFRSKIPNKFSILRKVRCKFPCIYCKSDESVASQSSAQHSEASQSIKTNFCVQNQARDTERRIQWCI